MRGGAAGTGGSASGTRAAGAGSSGEGAAGGTAGLGGALGGTAIPDGVAGCAGAAGVATRGGSAAGFGAGGVATRWVMARSTSPGLAMCDKSILVLISSASARAPARPLREAAAWPAASACARKCTRTLSASSASSELEWVFFSVMPTEGSTSRIALLLTSSSLAKSLIRIFCCIRPLFPPEFLYPFILTSLNQFRVSLAK